MFSTSMKDYDFSYEKRVFTQFDVVSCFYRFIALNYNYKTSRDCSEIIRMLKK